jgi:mono/diheme cytochrome c family protein
MACRSIVWKCLGVALLAGGLSNLRADDPRTGKSAPAADASHAPVAKVIQQYCLGCHNAKLKTAGLQLDSLDVGRIGEHPQTWEKVARKLRTGEMPPARMPRPDKATYVSATAELEAALDTAAAAKPNPGRIPVHRLNRAEYTAAIRDLLGLKVDGKALLSADDTDQEGFDNVASVLSVSPVLLENYLSAAHTISRLAIGDTALPAAIETYKYAKLLQQDDQMSEDLPFGSQGGGLIRHHFPLDGEYTIKALLRREFYEYIVGIGEPHQIDIRVDGVRIQRFTVGGEAKGMTMPESFAGNTQGSPEFEVYMHTADAGLEVRVPMKAGEHEVSVSFVKRFREPEGVQQPPQIGFGRTTNEYYHGNPAVEFVMIGGPYGTPAPGDSPSRRKIFVCAPKTPAAEEPCARKILSSLATRAYRRPVTEDDVSTLLSFYRSGRADKDFDAGIQRGLERILAAPSFLFRVEGVPANTTPGTAYRLSDLDLASRLSFFLWSSIPDDELLSLAIRGRLKDPKVLEQQVQRMLRDPRSQALVDGFANRWLGLSKLTGLVPDTDLYREFDENLRDAMAKETQHFVASQLHEDRSVAELLTADYTFVNERMAKHYGIPNIYGPRFRRVKFTDGIRGGLLGQASILAVTSYPNRTSVVVRGRWLLTNVLGSPPPPPPPDVPALKDPGADGQPRSLRQRMELHRQSAVCATCHQRMDPLGFALENFDALGKWRKEADGAPIDAASSLPDGTQFDGVSGLRQLMGSHKEDFARTFTEKLLAYAIGRGIESSDLPAIRKIARDAAQQDYKWSAVILGIVNSVPFNMSVAESDKLVADSGKLVNVAQRQPSRER